VPAALSTAPRVFTALPLAIDPDEVLRFQGYKKSVDTPSPEVRALFDEALALGRTLLAPRAVVRWLEVARQEADTVLAGGVTLTIPDVQRQWGPIEWVATAVCTIQPVLLDVPGVCSANLDALKFKNTSYNFSVRYTPVETVNLYATARKSYRSGGWNLFASAANGVASFEPEKVKDIEVGAKTEWLDRRLQANLALYHSKYTDIQKQRLTFLPNGTGVRMISNAAAAAINGAELEIRAKPTQGLTLDFQTTYTDPHYKNFVTRNPTTGAIADDRTAEPWEVPKWTFTVGAEQRRKVAPGELIARLDYSWRGDVIFAGTNQLTSTEQVLRQGSYGLLSGRLELALDHPDISIALIGRNLTDKDFLAGGIDLRSLGWSVGIPGEPRYVGLQITSRWR